jgi:hypothetical protein
MQDPLRLGCAAAAQGVIAIMLLPFPRPGMQHYGCDSFLISSGARGANPVLVPNSASSGSPPSAVGSQAMQQPGERPETGDRARERREEFLRRRLPEDGIRPPAPADQHDGNRSEDVMKEPPRERPAEDRK